MDPFSSGEELVIKTRKPYTISKQRERWTEEEHNRFLEALKLYGRAWQRIEEHIGTKTAVQIRSHAQKFFSKLEKEALAKGVPIGQAIDIDIPPPRPKRKPSNPYPRKKGITALGAQLRAKDGKSGAPASSSCCMQLMDLEKEPLPERANGDQKPTNPQDNLNESFSEVFTLLQDANCSSVSSVNKKSIQTSATLFKHGEFLQFVPSVKKTIKDNGTSNVSNMESSCTSNEKPVLWEKKEDLNCGLQTDEVQIIQDYPRPAPVHVVDGTLGICTEAPRDSRFQVPVFHPLREVQGQPNLFDGPAISLTAENHNNPSTSAPLSFPTFHSPYMPIGPDQNEFRSFLQASCTFSSLIVSTLLQNPAAHAAASFAATYWQYTGVDRSAESPIPDQEGFQSRQLNSAPSMAAIAAATVAAATAWWAANGMLPVCAPLHTAFACAPPLATAVPATHGQFPVGRMHGEENTDKKPPAQEPQQDHEHSEAVKSQHSVSKSQTSSSSDSEEIGEAKPNTGTKTLEQDKVEAENELQDANKLKSRKQVDRSSCGSNTASSSEVETDAIKKHEKGKEDLKEVDPDHPTTDSSNRRNSRSTSSNSDSWKEVSEEGRLAFQALFSREVLPQSFSPPHGKKDEQNADGKTGDASALDLNCNMWGSCPEIQVADKKALTSENKAEEKGLLTIGLGQGRLKARRTGFKPYQRCSVEAKENRLMSTTSNQGEEKCSKRIRLEAKASTQWCETSHSHQLGLVSNLRP